MRLLIATLLVSLLTMTTHVAANDVCVEAPSPEITEHASSILLAQSTKGPQCLSDCWSEMQHCAEKCNYAHVECRANCELDGKAAFCQTACGPLLKNCHANCTKTQKVCRTAC
jgi:hypothetical protein